MKILYLKKLTIILFVLLFSGLAVGQNRFQLLRTFELPSADENTWVFCMLQDRNGFMWFGTNRGLYKYDGVDFTIYKSRYDDVNSLSDNEIWSLMQDSKGKLWIGTKSGGISLLDIETENFKHYRKSSKGNGIPDNLFISSIFEDSEKTIWVASNGNGLGKYDEESDSFYYYSSDKANANSINQNYVTRIKEDPKGNIWVGLNGWGMDQFNKKTGQFVHYRFQESKDERLNFRNNVIRDFEFTDSGEIVTATFGGINVLNPKNRKFQHFDKQSGNSLKTDSFNGIFSLDKSKYVSSFKGYIYEISDDLESPRLVYSTSGELRSVLLDRDNMLWLGMNGGKIAYVNTENTFGFNKVTDTSIWTQCLVTSNNGLYLGTNYGIYGANGQTHLSPQQLEDPFVMDMETDDEGKLWVGTNTGGLAVFDSRTGKIEKFRYRPGDAKSLQHDTVLDIYKDSFGTVWISTMAGISRWMPDSKTFMTYGRTVFNDVIRPSKEELWCASNQGLVVLNLNNNNYYTKRSSLEHHKDSILHNEVLTLYSPDKDSIFIGTTEGINVFIRSQKKMLNLHEITNIPYVATNGIVQDQYRNYWASTDRGILHFDLNNGKYRFYGTNSGLDFASKSRGKNLIFDDESGQLIIGGHGGYYRFTPYSSVSDNSLVEVRITSVSVPDRVNKAFQRRVSRERDSLFEFSHGENMVSFTFSGLYYQNPERVNYRYRLKGLRDGWTTSSTRSATFANLYPGSYTFEVEASLNENHWAGETASVSFEINPPVWGTWWAYSLYALFLLGIGYYLVKAFVLRQRLKTRLRLEQLEVEKVQELSNLKSRFFANVSHEFRTPLTLIKGPVNDVLESKPDKSIEASLKLVQKNVHRLQQLINQLLDYSQITENKLPIRQTVRDVFSFLRAVSSSFISLAQEKGIDYELDIPALVQMALFDDEKIETILNNLVSNAIKFTDSSGTVLVRCQILDSKENQALLHISVQDTGRGLKEEEKRNIFRRFYRVNQQVDGIGIGLSLTKEFVDLLGGTIQVADNSPRGSVFNVALPIGLTNSEATKVFTSPVEEVLEKISTEGTIENETQTILLVEDNFELRQYIKQLLEPYGTVLHADNGAKALQMAKMEVPDIIVSDFMMPGMDGGELCRKVRKNEITSHIPFIMLTAKATKQDKIIGLEVGATDYIFKPFDRHELKLKVANILSQRNTLQKQIQSQLFGKTTGEVIDSQDNRFLTKFKELVLQNLDKSDLNVTFLSENMGMSRVQLYRKLKAVTGIPASDFIRKIRIQKSAKLIKNNWGNISEIAYEVGFNNLSYFTKCFKESFGVTPSQFSKSKTAI